MNASRQITKRPLQILRSKWSKPENFRSVWGQQACAWNFKLYVHHLFTNLIERNVFFHRTKFMMSRPRLHLPVQAMVCVAAFGFGLPLAIALFPQTSQVRSLITKKVNAALLIRPSLINGWLNCLGSRFRRSRLVVHFPAGPTKFRRRRCFYFSKYIKTRQS